MAGERTVTVWEADGQPWEGGGYGCDIRARLVLRGFEVRSVDLTERAPTDAEMAAPMHVVTGGNSPATTSTGWVPGTRERLMELLSTAHRAERNVVGICFGAQLIAVILAGPRAIRPTPMGMEAGMRRVDHHGGGRSFVVAQFHHHEIRPEALSDAGAELTYTNRHTTVQGYSVGPSITGYQFHPEFDPVSAAQVFRHNRRTIRATGGCVGEAMRSTRERRREWDPGTFDHMVTDRLLAHERPGRALAAPGGP